LIFLNQIHAFPGKANIKLLLLIVKIIIFAKNILKIIVIEEYIQKK
jgi:hypothetical protein